MVRGRKRIIANNVREVRRERLDMDSEKSMTDPIHGETEPSKCHICDGPHSDLQHSQSFTGGHNPEPAAPTESICRLTAWSGICKLGTLGCDLVHTFSAIPVPTKPHGPVSERFMRHHYGASGFMPKSKRVGLESVVVEGVWLRRIGNWVEVLVEIERKWKTIIREHFDGPFSHICEPTGIVKASYLEHDAPTEPSTGDPCENLPYRDCRTPNCIECAEPGNTVHQACGELAGALREFLGDTPDTEKLEALMTQYGPPPFSKEEVRKIVETVTFALRQQLQVLQTEPGSGVAGKDVPTETGKESALAFWKSSMRWLDKMDVEQACEFAEAYTTDLRTQLTAAQQQNEYLQHELADEYSADAQIQEQYGAMEAELTAAQAEVARLKEKLRS